MFYKTFQPCAHLLTENLLFIEHSLTLITTPNPSPSSVKFCLLTPHILCIALHIQFYHAAVSHIYFLPECCKAWRQVFFLDLWPSCSSQSPFQHNVQVHPFLFKSTVLSIKQMQHICKGSERSDFCLPHFMAYPVCTAYSQTTFSSIPWAMPDLTFTFPLPGSIFLLSA